MVMIGVLWPAAETERTSSVFSRSRNTWRKLPTSERRDHSAKSTVLENCKPTWPGSELARIAPFSSVINTSEMTGQLTSARCNVAVTSGSVRITFDQKRLASSRVVGGFGAAAVRDCTSAMIADWIWLLTEIANSCVLANAAERK